MDTTRLRGGRETANSSEFPVFFPDTREKASGDWFAADCFLRQLVFVAIRGKSSGAFCDKRY
jgi:hypothetical protein